MLLPIAILSAGNESDREFMQRLYVQYAMTMLRMARAVTNTPADAEDVVSDACVALIKKVEKLRQLDCNVLEGYIISTVKNTAYALHRKRKSRREVSDSEPDLEFAAANDPLPEEQLLLHCKVETMAAAFKALNEADQLVIRMKYFEKSSDKEIAEMLGIREISVRSRLTRARQRMQKWMEAEDNEE